MKSFDWLIAQNATNIDALTEDRIKVGNIPNYEPTSARHNLFWKYHSDQIKNINDELLTILTNAGLTPNNTTTQLLPALQSLNLFNKVTSFTDTSDAISYLTASVKLAGGLAVAKKVWCNGGFIGPSLSTNYIDLYAGGTLNIRNGSDIIATFSPTTKEMLGKVDRQTFAYGDNNNIYGLRTSDIVSTSRFTTGSFNTMFGYVPYITTQTGNAIFGSQIFSPRANYTVAIGHRAMGRNVDATITGDCNIGIGYYALGIEEILTGDNNIAIGLSSLQSLSGAASNNIGIGKYAGDLIVTGSNNIVIGNDAQVPTGTNSNQVRIGNTSITYAGIQVGWTITSDIRYKENIKDLSLGVDFISQLKPVEYKRIGNKKDEKEFGLIAQDLEKILIENKIENVGLLTKDDKGYMSIRYNDFIPILIKGIQEQQKEISKLKNIIKKLKI